MSLLSINQNVEIMRYYVSVTQMLNRVVSVDAESEEEALKKVNEANDNGEIEIDYEDNYSGEQIELDNDQDYWRDVDNENGDTLQHID